MGKRLENKICLISGTGGSMGRAAALLFASEGAKVVGCDVNEQRDRETQDLVRRAGGEMHFLSPCDLTKPENCERLVDFTIEKYGRIDVLYNNGAAAYFAWIEDLTDEIWHKTIDQELNLVMFLTRAAWPHLKKSGNASIISTGSVIGMIPNTELPGIAHSAAKAGVIALGRQFALEGRRHGVRANTISPGLIRTNATEMLLKKPGWLENNITKIMLGRAGEPEEVAATALFLASDESSFITGANIPVDGGTTAW